MFFTVAGIFLNSVAILSLWKSLLSHKKTYYYGIFVQSCIDLAVVAITHPWTIIASIDWQATHNDKALYVFRYISRVLYVFSFSSLVTMNIDRFLATNRPLFHLTSVTKLRLFTIMIVLQLINVVGPTIAKIRPLTIPGYTLTGVLVSASYIVTFYMNYKIFIKARRARRTLNKSRYVSIKRNSTCLLAVGFLCCCTLPAVVYYGLDAMSLCNNDTLIILNFWARTAAGMNSTFNCLIFFWKNENLRNEGKKVLKQAFVGRDK